MRFEGLKLKFLSNSNCFLNGFSCIEFRWPKLLIHAMEILLLNSPSEANYDKFASNANLFRSLETSVRELWNSIGKLNWRIQLGNLSWKLSVQAHTRHMQFAWFAWRNLSLFDAKFTNLSDTLIGRLRQQSRWKSFLAIWKLRTRASDFLVRLSWGGKQTHVEVAPSTLTEAPERTLRFNWNFSRASKLSFENRQRKMMITAHKQASKIRVPANCFRKLWIFSLVSEQYQIHVIQILNFRRSRPIVVGSQSKKS